MPLLSANDLATIRGVLERVTDTACTVKPRTITATSQAGHTPTWGAGTTTVCRINPGSTASKSEQGGRMVTKMRWTIALPYDTSVSAGDRIVVGSQTFTVIGFPDDQSFLAEIVAICEEVN